MHSDKQWSEYLGRGEESQIVISSDHIRGLAALLDYPEPPWAQGEVPPTGHWCSLFPYTRQSGLGEDGHERLGGFMPPIAYPRRMWAGSRIDYHHPLPVGEMLLRRSTIQKIENKQGSSGAMTFVSVSHEYLHQGILMIRDEHDIVYRDVPAEPTPEPVVNTDRESGTTYAYDWCEKITPDTTLLFRYSAITFNGHRIHYDQDYVRGEGYPGLLVHAPLTATLLLDLFQRQHPGVTIRRFEFRAQSPMFEGYPVYLYGRALEAGKVSLWAEDCEGRRALVASVETT